MSLNRPVEVITTLPPAEKVPGFRAAFPDLAAMKATDYAEGTIGFAPAEGADAGPYSYFEAIKLCDGQTRLANATWQSLLENPRFELETVDDSRIPDGDWRAALLRHAERIRDPKRPETELAALSATLLATPHEEVAAFLTGQMTAVFKAYPEGSLWFVKADRLFSGRFNLVRMLAAKELAPDYFDQHAPGNVANVASMRGQSLSGGSNISKLIDPLLLVFSPATLGYALGWMPHTLVFLTGQTSHMLRDHPATPWALYDPGLQTPYTTAARYADFIVDVPTGTIESLFQWWVRRLNVVYTHLLDPTFFADSFALHQPRSQLASLLTFERLLADQILIQTSFSGPELTRQQSAFDLLDKAESLLGFGMGGSSRGFELMLRRSSMLKRLDQIWDNVPVQARPRLRRWGKTIYDQLYDGVREGAYEHRRTGSAVKVWSPEKQRLVGCDLESFVPQLVRAQRNTAHGFIHVLTTDEGQAEWDRAILGSHDGRLPPELPDIAALLAFALVAAYERVIDGSWLPNLTGN
jgi:hypothetical protein